ncbi:MAG: aromatic ring-hydroxylating dioxygenase subunit alpha [Acidimicrobiia bacterium]|nr:aromatic ring-hydroxylating dioxygenase subunit alpha [Acidimicrobiia bacterium]
MDQALIDRIRADMAYEYDRTGPPEGFPAFPDIPVERHVGDEFWRLEQEHVWPRVWVMAGRAEDVPEPGDFFTFDDLGVPLVVVRGTDGEVRCFANTCQHRGAPVVREARGSARRLRCQYHSWSYDVTDGSLVAVPDERDFVGLDRSQRCLPQVSCAVHGGFVFVNRDPEAQPLEQWLGAAAEMLAPFDCGSLREIYRRSVEVPCNWKVTAEAFLEVYHFSHIHSHDGFAILDSRGAAMGLYPHGHSRMITPFSSAQQARVGMDGWDDWKPLDQGPFPVIDGVPDMVGCTSTAVSLFPNIIIPLAPVGFPINLFWPIDAHTTRLDWIYYGPRDWEGDELPRYWEILARNYDRIMGEDTANMAPIHASMASPALTGMPINYQERRIWHLHEQLDAMIGDVPEHLRVPRLLDPYVE